MSKPKSSYGSFLRNLAVDLVVLVLPEVERVEDLEDYREYESTKFVPGGGRFWVTQAERDAPDYIPY